MHPVITLTNGKRVSNFSSPHMFTFTDGSVLPAVTDEIAEKYKVDFIEKDHENGDVELSFGLSSDVLKRMNEFASMVDDDMVDMVLCPLPMLVAFKERFGMKALLASPFRSVRMESRISKLVSIEKQCV